VDAALLQQQQQLGQGENSSNLQVREMQNGCLCCTLVGQLEPALKELLAMTPDRIVIETSGSAFPASMAWERTRLHPITPMIRSEADRGRGYVDLP
jgi:G3E family GTPase